MDVIHLVANRQGQHVLPVQGVACCSPGSLTDNVRCGADVAILLFFDGPHPAFFLAIGIGEVFLKSAGVALPTALHVDPHAADNLPRTILDDTVGNDRPVEIFPHVEARFLAGVVSKLHRTATGGEHGKERTKKQPE